MLLGSAIKVFPKTDLIKIVLKLLSIIVYCRNGCPLGNH